MATSTEAGFGSDGRVAGRYRLLEPIGSGGMGRVYRAHDEVLDREVAVKLLEERPAAGADLGFAYAEEARAAARLTHPGIARVYDSGLQDGRCFVTPDGTPKLVDFGIARAADAASTVQTAELFGSVAYLAPEQARGERLDARTDVYALGSVLYELLTSRPPWTGASAVTTACSNSSGMVASSERSDGGSPTSFWAMMSAALPPVQGGLLVSNS
jgi:serine/threonine protein kinase